MTKLTKVCRVLNATLLASCHAGAYAQAVPPAAPSTVVAVKPAPVVGPAAPVVTVQAERPANRVDRQVYDLKNDAGATNNSAADALNNVPSVSVDPDGTVSLRGSTNVQILIDGKPAAMLQGEGRGAALNALPSNDIESIEVINNPGAQFGNEGSGGPVLNLVMRRNRTPGGMAVLNANAGPSGRANSALSGSYQSGRLSFQGGVNVRRDGRDSTADIARERIDPLSGARTASRQLSQASGLNNAAGLNAGLTYNIDAKNTVGAQFGFMRRSNDQQGKDRYQSPGTPPRGGDYLRQTSRNGDSKNSNWSVRLDHKGLRPGETFKLDLRMSDSGADSTSAFANQYPDVADSAFITRSRQQVATATTLADLSADYERPVPQGVVKLGFKFANQTNAFDTSYLDLLGPVALINGRRTNAFEVQEKNLALYGSYQRRLDARWGVLGGVRVEHTALDVRQLTSAVDADNSDVNVIPSMFVNYTVSDDASLRLSYAHRIGRPNGNDLNPFIVYRDQFNVAAGNPHLGPSQTDSLELGYETKIGVVDTNLRAFYRQERDVIVERSYFVDDTVLLTTRDNSGENRAAGVEFSLSGKLTPTFSFNTSGNWMRTEQQSLEQSGLERIRTGSALSMRARLNYQFTPAGLLQFTVNAQGRALTGQGYREPATTANLSLRHLLTPRLSLVLNVTDIFDNNKTETLIDTPLLRGTSVRRFDGRVAYLGLSYRLGGVSGAARAPGARRQGRSEEGWRARGREDGNGANSGAGD